MLVKSFAVGDEITGFYLIKQIEVKQTNANPPKNYLDIVFGDQSGEITAKLWDATPTDCETFFAPMMVKIKGIVQSYRDKLQFRIERIRPTTDEDGVTITDFIRSAPVQPIDLVHVIKTTIDSVLDSDYKSILKYCFDKIGDKIMHYPAAKSVHHAFYAGLAYHINRMLELAEFICKQRPFLNRDLLVTGIILHDIAKAEEMDAELGVVSDYSLKGKLIGHISLVYGWIVEATINHKINLNDEKIIALQHLLLSHHNLGEWGSPVQPQLPEAVALHYIDQIDAKLQAVEDALDTTPDSQDWTESILAIERKPIYKMKL